MYLYLRGKCCVEIYRNETGSKFGAQLSKNKCKLITVFLRLQRLEKTPRVVSPDRNKETIHINVCSQTVFEV
jgi:hypothetical protein